MRELPMLFATRMVQAILDNRKTMTRRTTGLDDINLNPDEWDFKNLDFLGYMTKKSAQGKYGAYFESTKIEPNTLLVCPVVCPYGQPRDKLYVKETWKIDSLIPSRPDYPVAIDFKAVQSGYSQSEVLRSFTLDRFNKFKKFYQKPGWQSPYFMPKEAARIFLEVVSVRVERLQDITLTDIRAEGLVCPEEYRSDDKEYNFRHWFLDEWKRLWDSINLKRGYGWNMNPYVWVVGFRGVDYEQKQD